MGEKVNDGDGEQQQQKPGALPDGASGSPPMTRREFEAYITKHECARRLSKTTRSVDTYMALGIIPYYKLGRSVIFRWSEVDQHIQAHFRVCLRGSK